MYGQAALIPVLSPAPKDLQLLNTLGLRAWAGRYLAITHADQLVELSELWQRDKPALFVLGGGSNVVLSERVAPWVVHMQTQGCTCIDTTASHHIVEAQAGENWHRFVGYCLQQHWRGLENLALIPGTVGAAPVQNIGAYGVELDQRFHSLLAWDVHRACYMEFGPADCAFAYRDSFFKRQPMGRWIIVRVRFALPRQWQPVLSYPDLQRHPVLSGGDPVSAQQVFDAVCEIRRAKLPDPAVVGNAGSFFKNPVVSAETCHRLKSRYPDLVAYELPDAQWKLAAGWLIDRAGWKGHRRERVGVHSRQALVLVNLGNAVAGDISTLANDIRNDVANRFGVMLEQEPVAV